jgi:ferric-dicitrate binding protein FerR (iron transport regulator)
MSGPDREDLVRDLLRQARPAPVDPVRAARVRQAVRAAWLEQQTPRPTVRPWWIGAAVAAAAMVVVYVMVGRPGDGGTGRVPPTPVIVASTTFVTGSVTVRLAGSGVERALNPGDPVAAGSTIVTGAGGRGALLLADGVEVRFDRETTATLAAERRLELGRGGIYIDTSVRASGSQAAVDVVALGALVRDIGTRYEVRVIDEALRVRVRDGRVQVTRGAETREAGEQTELALDAAGMRLSPSAGFGADWDWIVRAIRTPPIEGRSLAEFLAWVERESGRQVRFGDPAAERAAATTIVYGVIDGLSVDEALTVVLPTCGLAHQVSGRTIIILPAESPRGAR